MAAPAPAKQRATTPTLKTLDELAWVDLPQRPGVKTALLSGDLATSAFTVMRKVPGGSDNSPHTHTNELTNIVIRGVWYTGADMASAKDFGPGSVVLMPAGWTHVSGCRAGEDCVFYQVGDGAFDFKPVK